MSLAFLLPKERFGRAVLEEVARHPVIPAGAGEVFDGFSEVAAMRLDAALARGADQDHRESLVEGHGDQRGLTVARDALDAHLLRVHRSVGFEIIQSA